MDKVNKAFDQKMRMRKFLIKCVAVNICPACGSNMFLPKPPINEQKKIAEILTSADDEIGKELNHREQLQLLKKSLMEILLTGKVRVAV